MNQDTKNSRISGLIFDKISKENLKMRSLFYFIALSLAWRVSAALVLFLSSVIFSVAIYIIFSLGQGGGDATNWRGAIKNFPFFLVLFGTLLVFFSSRLYRKSRLCCRHEDWMLFFALGFVSLVVAAFLHKTGMAFRFYQSVEGLEAMKIFIP